MNGDANSDCLDNNTTGVLNSNKEFCIGGTDSIEFPDSSNKLNNYIIYEINNKYRLVKTAENLIAKVTLLGNLR